MKNCLIGIPTYNLLQPMTNFTITSILLIIKYNIYVKYVYASMVHLHLEFILLYRKKKKTIFIK